MLQGPFVRALVREHANIERRVNASTDDGVTVNICRNIHRIKYVLLAKVLVTVVAVAQER